MPFTVLHRLLFASAQLLIMSATSTSSWNDEAICIFNSNKRVLSINHIPCQKQWLIFTVQGGFRQRLRLIPFSHLLPDGSGSFFAGFDALQRHPRLQAYFEFRIVGGFFKGGTRFLRTDFV